MAPPAASATARANAAQPARARRAATHQVPRRSVWILAGSLIGHLIRWLVFWPLRTIARGAWASLAWTFRRPARAALLTLAVASVLAAGYWFWLRNSPWVGVQLIRVEGTTTQIDDINTA